MRRMPFLLPSLLFVVVLVLVMVLVLMFLLIIMLRGSLDGLVYTAAAFQCLRGGRNCFQQYLPRLARITSDAVEPQPVGTLADLARATAPSSSYPGQ